MAECSTRSQGASHAFVRTACQSKQMQDNNAACVGEEIVCSTYVFIFPKSSERRSGRTILHRHFEHGDTLMLKLNLSELI